MDEQTRVTLPTVDPVVAPVPPVQPNLDQKWYNKLRKFWPIAVVVAFATTMVVGLVWLGWSGKIPAGPGENALPSLAPLGVTPASSDSKKLVIAGYVATKDSDGLVVVTPDEWVKVFLAPGQEITIAGYTKKKVVWEKVEQGEPVEIVVPDEATKVARAKREATGSAGSK